MLECVAEKYQRPLFTISCGDLGISARDLESRLKEVFQLAVTWKAILLLDEADIFLQERDVHNIERNALVSVFLRELDYFEGILFVSEPHFQIVIALIMTNHSSAPTDQAKSTKPSYLVSTSRLV